MADIYLARHEEEPARELVVKRLQDRGWANFATDEADDIKRIRGEIVDVAKEIGLDVQEFRRIVAMRFDAYLASGPRNFSRAV